MTHLQRLCIMAGMLITACAPAPPLPEPVSIPIDTETASTPSPRVSERIPPARTADTDREPDATSENPTQDPSSRFLEYRYFPSAKAALLDVISTAKPRVIGFGEYHSQTGHHVTSALSHFSSDLLPAISSVTSDIVVEAMVTEGDCVKLEEQVTTEVKEDTQRPEETEDEVTVLFKQARTHGVFPHYLTMTCDDHQSIYGSDEVDYDKLLRLIGTKLLNKTSDVMSSRTSQHRKKSKPIIAIYGGAIHNDANPQKEWRSYSVGPLMKKKLPDGKYIEIDLIVPEIAKEIPFVQEAEWFALFKDKVSPKKTLLIKISDTEYMLVFPGRL